MSTFTSLSMRDGIGFLQMPDLVENCLSKVSYLAEPALDDYVQTDQETRRVAQDFLKH